MSPALHTQMEGIEEELAESLERVSQLNRELAKSSGQKMPQAKDVSSPRDHPPKPVGAAYQSARRKSVGKEAAD